MVMVRVFSQVATFQICNFPKVSLGSLRLQKGGGERCGYNRLGGRALRLVRLGKEPKTTFLAAHLVGLKFAISRTMKKKSNGFEFEF